MNFSVTFYFGNKNVESHFRDESHHAESIATIESLIVRDLKKGLSIEYQKTFWTEMLENINKNWDFVEVGSGGMRNFQIGIVILRKLKVELDREYGYFDTETFKLIHSDGFTDSKEFRKLYKKATGKNVSRPCSICQTETTKRCSCCKKVYYCSEACQQSDWKNHRNKK